MTSSKISESISSLEEVALLDSQALPRLLLATIAAVPELPAPSTLLESAAASSLPGPAVPSSGMAMLGWPGPEGGCGVTTGVLGDCLGAACCCCWG